MNAFVKVVTYISVTSGGTTAALAAPTVYIPLGSGNQVVAVDAATDGIIANYPGVDNPHGLVATPDGEYTVAGSVLETPPGREGRLRVVARTPAERVTVPKPPTSQFVVNKNASPR